MTLPRGRSHPDGRRGHVVDYRHVIHALKRKPMALLDLVYRDALFPRQAYARTFERLRECLSPRAACTILVQLLALAHERACEAELAERLTMDLDQGHLPDLAELTALFGPKADAIPDCAVITLTPLSAYDELGTVRTPAAMPQSEGQTL